MKHNAFESTTITIIKYSIVTCVLLLPILVIIDLLLNILLFISNELTPKMISSSRNFWYFSFT